MKGKFVCTLVCTLLILTVLQATGRNDIEEKKVFICGLAPKLNNNIQNLKISQNQINNKIDILGMGKTAYAYRAYPSERIVSFDLDNPGVLNDIEYPSSSDFISGGTWVDGTWWGCEYSSYGNSNIWTIDHETGEMELIGPSGSSEGLNGLAYYEYNNTLYAAGSNNLYTIDMETANASLVGPYGEGLLMIGIAFDSLGNLYGECIQTDSLYSIDRKTGEATIIGDLGGIDILYAQDMAIDKDTDICYLAAFTVSPIYEGALYTCDLSTGTATKVGTFGVNVTEITGFAIPYHYGGMAALPVLDYTNIKGGFLKISAELNNLGNISISNVNWSMEKKSGFLLFPEDEAYGVVDITAGEYVTIEVMPVIGLGPSTVVFRYSYSITPDKSDCELFMQGEEEWDNLGLILFNLPDPNEPQKEWVDINEVEYFSPQENPYAKLIFYDIDTWHNIRVVVNQKSSSEIIRYQSSGKFENGIASVFECHVTIDFIRSRQGKWQIELVGDEIEEYT